MEKVYYLSFNNFLLQLCGKYLRKKLKNQVKQDKGKKI